MFAFFLTFKVTEKGFCRAETFEECYTIKNICMKIHKEYIKTNKNKQTISAQQAPNNFSWRGTCIQCVKFTHDNNSILWESGLVSEHTVQIYTALGGYLETTKIVAIVFKLQVYSEYDNLNICLSHFLYSQLL